MREVREGEGTATHPISRQAGGSGTAPVRKKRTGSPRPLYEHQAWHAAGVLLGSGESFSLQIKVTVLINTWDWTIFITELTFGL